MSKETLTVRNFGPIKEADLDLRKVTVFIGEQASGKSCLAKLLAICGNKSAPQILKESEFKKYRLANFFHGNSIFRYSNKDYKVGYDSKGFNRKFFSIRLGEIIAILEESRNRYFEVLNLFEKETNDSKRGDLKAESDNWRSAITEAIHLMNEIVFESVYVPAERTLVSISEKQVAFGSDLITDYLSMFDHLYRSGKRELGRINFKPLSIEFDGDSENIIQKGNSYKLTEVSSGLQSAIPLFILIESNLREYRRINFIIEEPELNLYPTTQKKLVEYLIEKCTKGDNRLVITTHSPYILTALNNCIEAANVRKSNPEAAAEVDKLVPRESQIDFEDVAAYFVGGGTARSIMNHENQLIDANALDEISEEIGRTFDQLLDLKYQNQD